MVKAFKLCSTVRQELPPHAGTATAWGGGERRRGPVQGGRILTRYFMDSLHRAGAAGCWGSLVMWRRRQGTGLVTASLLSRRSNGLTETGSNWSSLAGFDLNCSYKV